jgi:integrase
MANRLKLTTTTVDRLNDAGIYWDTQTPGLGIRVSDSGRRTYFYKRRVKGSGIERNVSLGRHLDPVLLPDGSLRTFPFGADDARARAAAVQAQMLAGVDPVQRERDATAAAVVKAAEKKVQGTSLQTVVTDYLEHHRVKGRPLRPKTKKDYREFMERHFEKWLPEPVAVITRTMCDDRIREIEAKSPIQAHKARVYLRMFLNSATSESGAPILSVNPVTLMKTKTHAPKPKLRRVSLPKVGHVWLMLRARSANPSKELDRTAADFVTTLLITGWRASECAALEWAWINFDAKTVTLPDDLDTDDERAFAGVKTHATVTFPLSDVLCGILEVRKALDTKDERYVFPGRADSEIGHITTAIKTMAQVAKAADMELVSPHDLRRTYTSLARACRVDYADRLHLLNHSSKNVHDDYERDGEAESLRTAVNAIANYIVDASKVAEAQASGHNVISFPGKTG